MLHSISGTRSELGYGLWSLFVSQTKKNPPKNKQNQTAPINRNAFVSINIEDEKIGTRFYSLAVTCFTASPLLQQSHYQEKSRWISEFRYLMNRICFVFGSVYGPWLNNDHYVYIRDTITIL